MTWIFRDRIFTPADVQDYYGFVYLITNLTNERMYIGQKKFTFAKRIQRNKKKKRIRVASDWEDYYGSNTELQEDVKKLGADKFERVILYLCQSKSWMNYLELQEQMRREVLLDEAYYNSYAGTRLHKKHFLGKKGFTAA
jgi:hypothetical protein